MELKPGYKQTEVGVIPEDWVVKYLGDMFYFSGGFSASRDQLSETGYCYLHYGDIHSATKTTIDTSNDSQEIPKLFIPLNKISPKSMLKNGDVVFVDASEDNEGTSRHVVIVNKDDIPFISGLHTIVAKSKIDEVVHEYRRFCFQSDIIRRQFRFYAAGTKVSGISKSNIPKLLLPLPPTHAEQRAIAYALSDVDALLESLDQLIPKKRNIKQAAMQELLTGTTRLPGFDGEWREKRLGDHLKFLKNGVNSRAELIADGGVKYLHYGDIHGSESLLINPCMLQMPCLPVSKASRLDRLSDGDLVFADASEDLDGVGKSVEFHGVGQNEVVSGLHTIAIRFDKNVLADGFKAYLQFMPTFRQSLKRLAAGTKVYATNRAHISIIELKLPGLKEQTAIATFLSDMDDEIVALEQRRKKTRDIKQAMMQELLTGKTRLL